MTTTLQRPAAAAQHHRRALDLPRTALLVALVVGTVVRLHSRSGIWLDEALTINISRRDLPGLLSALKRDGSPPLYYLLQHGWMQLFGQGADAVRALSTVFGIAAIGVAYVAGSRLRDRVTGGVAALLLATSPFAVRYSTETRMYSLVVLLVLVGVVVLHAALAQPTLRRLVLVPLVGGALLLTHYWALYLLATVGLGLLLAAWKGSRPEAARRCAVALTASVLPFLPWLPSFAYQAARTGTPWAPAPPPKAVTDSVTAWAGGPTFGGGVLSLVLWGLLALAVLGTRTSHGLLLSRPRVSAGPLLAVAALGTLAVGVLAGQVTNAGFAPRYSSISVAPFLLAAAVGTALLAPRVRVVVVAVALATGMTGSVYTAVTTDRTQAPVVAAALRVLLHPGDLIVYCPDQTGPAVARLLPGSTDQVMYPTFQRPDVIDWTDYAQRNHAASPVRFAEAASARATGAVWLVASVGHLTFGSQCAQLGDRLAQLRGEGTVVLTEDRHYRERDSLTRFR